MKLKRMESKEVHTDKYDFKVRPFGAMYAAYIFGDVMGVIAPILGTIALASQEKPSMTINLKAYDMELDANSVANALGRLNGKQLTEIISELLLEHNNVSFYDEGTWKPLRKDDFDEMFCMSLAGAFTLCYEVLMLNYGNFFGDVRHLFGDAMKRLQVDQSKNMVSSTENK